MTFAMKPLNIAEEQVAFHLLNKCRGVKNAKKSSQLQEKFGYKGRELREIINSLRCKGVPICSGGQGYWFAGNSYEIKNTVNQMVSRIMAMREAVEGLECFIVKEDAKKCQK